MSAQLDRIEDMLTRLLRHLGVEGAAPTAPSPEVDQKLIEKYAEAHKRATHAALKNLFHEDTDELTDLGKNVVPDAWMTDGLTPKS